YPNPAAERNLRLAGERVGGVVAHAAAHMCHLHRLVVEDGRALGRSDRIVDPDFRPRNEPVAVAVTAEREVDVGVVPHLATGAQPALAPALSPERPQARRSHVAPVAAALPPLAVGGLSHRLEVGGAVGHERPLAYLPLGPERPFAVAGLAVEPDLVAG